MGEWDHQVSRRTRALAPMLALFAVTSCDPARPEVAPAASSPVAPPPAPALGSAADPGASAAVPAPPAASSEAQAAPPRKQDLAVVGKDDNVVLEVDKDGRHSVVARVRFHRDVVWQHP